jgi:hypothetical protein
MSMPTSSRTNLQAKRSQVRILIAYHPINVYYIEPLEYLKAKRGMAEATHVPKLH